MYSPQDFHYIFQIIFSFNHVCLRLWVGWHHILYYYIISFVVAIVNISIIIIICIIVDVVVAGGGGGGEGGSELVFLESPPQVIGGSHLPITIRLQSGLVVTLDLLCRTITGEVCVKSVPLATRSFFLQPSSTFQRSVSVCRPHFSRQDHSKRFFPSEESRGLLS